MVATERRNELDKIGEEEIGDVDGSGVGMRLPVKIVSIERSRTRWME